MSYHPEEQKGWSEERACPYCGHDDFEYIDSDGYEDGVAATFSIDVCECTKCGKRFKVVGIVSTEFYGVYKGGEE